MCHLSFALFLLLVAGDGVVPVDGVEVPNDLGRVTAFAQARPFFLRGYDSSNRPLGRWAFLLWSRISHARTPARTRRRLIAPVNSARDNPKARVALHEGNAANIGRWQIPALRGSLANTKLADEIGPRHKHVTAGQLDFGNALARSARGGRGGIDGCDVGHLSAAPWKNCT
jgi:hypothetical protein